MNRKVKRTLGHEIADFTAIKPIGNRYDAFKRILGVIWPEDVDPKQGKWNDWTERTLRQLCDDKTSVVSRGNRVKTTVMSGCAAASKAQPLDSIVYTPDGPRLMWMLAVGDLVCTPDGRSAPITGIFPHGKKDIYEIELSDGSKTRCCLDHLWKVEDRTVEGSSIVTTEYLLHHFERGKDKRNQLGIKFTNPVHFNSRIIGMHPYLMGVLLGDGMFGGRDGRNDLMLSSVDTGILERVRTLVGDDYRLNRRSGGSCDYSIVKSVPKAGSPNRFKDALRSYGLWGKLSHEKFIPSAYFYNDIETRLELLRGLLDTDGCVSRGHAQYSSTSMKLAEGVRTLVQSIGGSCRISKQKTSYHYNGVKKSGKDVYSCSIQVPDASVLFSLERKKQKCVKRRFGAFSRKICGVRLVGNEPVQCISIDHPEHLYLTDNFIPTHNTWASGMYAFAWWAVAPEKSIVIFTSTTREMIRRRIWPVVQHFFHNARGSDGETREWPLFNKVESRTTIQYIGDSDDEAPSDKNAIFAMAVAHGETQKAAHNLRGMHSERILLVIDEANGTPEAIFESIPNQRKGCKNYEAIIIGNPISHLDPHGQCALPKDGWGVIGEDTEQWETAGVDKWQIEPGICLRFDGKLSPNVRAGEDHWPFIYTTSDWKRACDPRKEKTLAYWSQDRGLWPPDGFVNSIINEAMLAKYDPENGYPFTWISKKRMVAFLDPAFGGDDCKLYIAEVGDIEGGKEGIQIVKDVTVTFEYASRDEIDYIIARRCIEECKAHGVEPECFGLDRTGTGRGVAAVISAEWSNSIHQVEFGSMATDRASSTADGRPAREVYYNRTTEMAWSMREFLEAGQLRGIPHQARLEACLRTYTVTGRRYKLEPKSDFKARLGYSCDDLDACAGICDVVRNMGIGAITRNTTSRNTSWEKLMEQNTKQPVMEMFDEAVEGDIFA